MLLSSLLTVYLYEVQSNHMWILTVLYYLVDDDKKKKLHAHVQMKKNLHIFLWLVELIYLETMPRRADYDWIWSASMNNIFKILATKTHPESVLTYTFVHSNHSGSGQLVCGGVCD